MCKWALSKCGLLASCYANQQVALHATKCNELLLEVRVMCKNGWSTIIFHLINFNGSLKIMQVNVSQYAQDFERCFVRTFIVL